MDNFWKWPGLAQPQTTQVLSAEQPMLNPLVDLDKIEKATFWISREPLTSELAKVTVGPLLMELIRIGTVAAGPKVCRSSLH